MKKNIQCKECGGVLYFIEEVMGSFEAPIDQDGVIDFESKDYSGDSWTYIKCGICGEEYGLDSDFIYSEEDNLTYVGDKYYKDFVDKVDINPNCTKEWICLTRKLILRFNFKATVISSDLYTSIIGKEEDLKKIEKALYYVEREKTTLNYIFEGEVYATSSDEIYETKKELMSDLLSLDKDIECILAGGYVKKGDFEADRELRPHTPETDKIWEAICSLCNDDELIIDSIVKNYNENFPIGWLPIGWLIEESNTITGDWDYIQVLAY